LVVQEQQVTLGLTEYQETRDQLVNQDQWDHQGRQEYTEQLVVPDPQEEQDYLEREEQSVNEVTMVLTVQSELTVTKELPEHKDPPVRLDKPVELAETEKTEYADEPVMPELPDPMVPWANQDLMVS
jgi:hypothetical protein